MILICRWRFAMHCFCSIAFSFGCNIALADFVSFGNGYGSKWGNPIHGTPSGVVTWSFMAGGTTLASSHPLIQGGAIGSSDIASIESLFDANYGAGSFQQSVENAFNTWSVASAGRVSFQKVSDNGSVAGDSNNAASYATDIRIGAFHSTANSSFSFVGAVGYGPPGDDISFPDALAGDILINLDSQFMKASGNEGDVFYNGGEYKNDLEGLILHELGHAAIGLGHSNNNTVPGLGDVMYVDNFPSSVNFINRQLSPQDIAGLQTVYGITAVPEPNTLVLTATFIFVIGFGAARTRRRRQLFSGERTQ